MNRLLSIISLAAISLTGANAQTLVVGWDFQTTTNGGTAAIASPGSPLVYKANFANAENMSGANTTAALYLDGQHGSSPWTSSGNAEVTAVAGTATLNRTAKDVNGNTLLFENGTALGALSLLGGTGLTANGKYAVFQFSMEGYKDLAISYAIQKSNTGFAALAWEYSLDGVNYSPLSTVSTIPTSFALQTLPTISALDNTAVVYVRFSGNGATQYNGSCRLDNIQFNATAVSAATYTITSTAGANGSITPSGAVPVTQGASQAFTITPDTDFVVDVVLVDAAPVALDVNSQYTFTNVQGNSTIHATFKAAPTSYTITASAGENGSISPSGTVPVTPGASEVFTITPDLGFVVAEVLVNGLSVGARTTYTFLNVTADATIAASFVSADAVPKLVAGWDFQTTTNGGTAAIASVATPPTPSPLVYFSNFANSENMSGANTTAALYLDGTHGSSAWTTGITNPQVTSFTSTTLNGTAVDENGTNITFDPTTTGAACLGLANNTANGKFAVFAFSMAGYKDLAISYATRETGTGFNTQVWEYSLNGTTYLPLATVTGKNDATFSVQSLAATSELDNADVAYIRLSFTGATDANGNNRLDNIQFNAMPVGGDTHIITATAGDNGSITPSGAVSVYEGSNKSFTITPDTGYLVDDVLVDSLSVGAKTSHTFTNVITTHTIHATFKLAPPPTTHTITASAGANGSISPSGAVPVIEGANQVFTITPDKGYGIDTLLINGTSVKATKSYTFTNVTTDATISVTFKAVEWNELFSEDFSGVSADSNITTSNTAFTYARVGTGGSLTAADSTVLGGTAAKVFANSTSLTGIGVTSGTFAPVAIGKLCFDFNIAETPATGIGLFFSMGSGTNFSDNNTFVTNQQSIAGAVNYNTTLMYRQLTPTSAWVNITAAGTLTTATKYSVKMVFNNSEEQITYDGGNILDSGKADFWLNGVLVASVNMTNAIDATAFRIYTSQATYEIANVQMYSKDVPDPVLYTITASAGDDGEISPSGAITVTGGKSQTFTVLADPNYVVDTVLVDGAPVALDEDSQYTFTNVRANASIHATFKIPPPIVTYTITSSAGANGTISPSGATSVNEGTSQAFTITPAEGFVVDDVLVDSIPVGARTTYTFSDVQANHSISVTFKTAPPVVIYTITASAGANGSISPSGAVSANSGTNQTFTISPAVGYMVDTVLVDGAPVELDVNSQYTFINVQADASISATFTPAPNEPSLVAGWDFQTTTNGGTAAIASVVGTPSPLVYKANFANAENMSGANTTAALYLDGSHGSSTWTTGVSSPQVTSFGGAGAALNGTAYDVYGAPIAFHSTTTGAACLGLANSSANGKFAVFAFSMAGYQDLSISYAMQGSGTGFSSQIWEYSLDGTNYLPLETVSSIPTGFAVKILATTAALDDADTVFVRVSFTGASGAAGNNRLDNIQFNATFVSDPPTTFTITATAGANGSITPSGAVSVTPGADQAFTITPSANYMVDTIHIDGMSVGALTTYTFEDVQADHEISATFKLIPAGTFVISASASSGGTITPNGEISVTAGANQTFTVTPALGYIVQEVLVNDAPVGLDLNSQYTFSNVQADYTIHASFIHQEASVTITFAANSGTGSMLTQSFTAGEYQALAQCTFLPPQDLVFSGWNTQANGSGTYYADGKLAAFTADTTLYAQWGAAAFDVNPEAMYGVGRAGTPIIVNAKNSSGEKMSISAKNLPAGMKLAFNKDTQKWEITGTPTALPKAAPYIIVKIGKVTHPLVYIPISLVSLPAQAIGTFTGWIEDASEVRKGSWTLKATNKGAITAAVSTVNPTTGKLVKTSFKSKSWATAKLGEEEIYSVEIKILDKKTGAVLHTLDVSVDTALDWNTLNAEGSYGLAVSPALDLYGQRNAFLDKAPKGEQTPAQLMIANYLTSYYTYGATIHADLTRGKLPKDLPAEAHTITFTLKATGTSSMSGRRYDGINEKSKPLYTAWSGSTVVLAIGDTLVFSPYAYKLASKTAPAFTLDGDWTLPTLPKK